MLERVQSFYCADCHVLCPQVTLEMEAGGSNIFYLFKGEKRWGGREGVENRGRKKTVKGK